MSHSDTTEKGLEDLIVAAMTAQPSAPPSGETVQDSGAAYSSGGWIAGDPKDYEREYAVDLVQLREFVSATQPDLAGALHLDSDDPVRQKFLARLQGEVTKRGVIDVLRNGVKHGAHNVELMFGTPSPDNKNATELYAKNRFTVTRQFQYSRDETQLALDLGLFINGLPVITQELKNSLTKQTVADAVNQYKRDRDQRELLFRFGRCIAHFAVDDAEVEFCTELRGDQSWFLPFNQGRNDGAGNPLNPEGLKTDFLWRRILAPASLIDIIENYAQVVEQKDPKTGRKKRSAIFPRYHQLDVVRRLLADIRTSGAGKRYLIQHSAGSGKSNSIAWLAHQLVSVERAGERVFDSIIVVTDRVILDTQICDTIKQFAQVGAIVGHASKSGDLRTFIKDGKKIIITTVQKFPHILDDIGAEHRDRRFALVIDEAHSGQGGRNTAAVAMALAEKGAPKEEETTEDQINRIMESRKMLPNASYFAFTATPKNKTLEIFGEPYTTGGATKHRPFHSYTMKQAVQEGFILDVLKHYTPVESYYRLVKTVEADPEFDLKKARKKLRRYVENHEHAIRLKAEIVVDHFHEQVIGLNKIGGAARAMVVTSGVARALEYFHAITAYLAERKSPYQAIVAFSGEHSYGGAQVTEALLNGFPSKDITDKIQEDPYRILVCADKFQTGYDEPLLHTMYVDKVLSGIRAVQTLSRLNRAHPRKGETFVLDFVNDASTILDAFADYYRTTVLSEETDPNKLHDLKNALDARQVYSPEQIDQLVALYLGGADRDQLDPILDVCVDVYREHLDEDGQIDFKGKAKAFVRTYGFLAAILPYTDAGWEKLSIFLNFLISKLPAPVDEDLAKGILETIDMDSYRVEKRAVMAIQLPDQDAEIEPVPASGGGHKAAPELEQLSTILKGFNDLFGNIPWTDSDRVQTLITETIPAMVSANPKFKHACANSDLANVKVEHNAAVGNAVTAVLNDDTQFYKQFHENPSFKKYVLESVFQLAFEKPADG